MSNITDSDIHIVNPPFNKLGYVIGVANLQDKHDRSAPSDYHWKIFKCRFVPIHIKSSVYYLNFQSH